MWEEAGCNSEGLQFPNEEFLIEIWNNNNVAYVQDDMAVYFCFPYYYGDYYGYYYGYY